MENTKAKTAKLNVDSRIWINIGNESFLGQGKIELMEKIIEFGSLRKAAENMKMSYRKAWGSIYKINSLAGKPLVILNRGGKDGGMAEVTKDGKKVILLFKQLQEKVNKVLEKELKSLEF